MKFLIFLSSFVTSLNDFLIAQLKVFNLIGEDNIKPSPLIFLKMALLNVLLAPKPLNKMVALSANTGT